MASARPSRGATSTAPRDRDHVDGDALLGEVASRGVRVGGRDTQTGEVRDRLVGRVRRDGGFEPAVAVPELADLRQLRAGLGEQVARR